MHRPCRLLLVDIKNIETGITFDRHPPPAVAAAAPADDHAVANLDSGSGYGGSIAKQEHETPAMPPMGW
jgi:hypothetical protein